MELDKSCMTCKFNSEGTCLGSNYGKPIVNFKIQRECWSISLEYSIELAKLLPKDEQLIYECDGELTVNDLVRRVEIGEWGFKHTNRKTIVKPNGEKITY